MMNDGRVRVPVELRFEYSDAWGKWIYRPYVELGSGPDKIELGAEFGPLNESSERHVWYFNFKISDHKYRVLCEGGWPLAFEKNHHIMPKKSDIEYADFLSQNGEAAKPWIRLP